MRSKGKGVEVASNVRPLRPEDFVQLPEAKFLKGLDGSPNLGAVPGFSGAPHGGKELPIRVARQRLRHSNSPKKLADASAVGFLDGTELVQFVAENYSQVREIEDGLAIVWRNGKGVTVFVRLQRSQDGGYYTVTSSGIRSNEQIDRWKLLWSRTPTPDSTAG